MDTIETSPATAAESYDEVPLDLAFAQHNLQKLKLASAHNFWHMRESIAHQLRRAEQALLSRGSQPEARKHLDEIARARRLLEDSIR